PVLVVFASALAFSHPALHRVRYRKSELFVPWLKRLALLSLAFAIPVAVQLSIEFVQQIARLPKTSSGRVYSTIYFNMFVMPFLWYLPYVCAGMGVGTVARRSWLPLI